MLDELIVVLGEIVVEEDIDVLKIMVVVVFAVDVVFTVIKVGVGGSEDI
ncbi:MAG: hypothetical protein M1382_04130 [Candidatus Marsarchaeota archaeon]|nr:hypothetical protein [Candidatus Marsarchaeota archaeon]